LQRGRATGVNMLLTLDIRDVLIIDRLELRSGLA
jgi:hypothetical protein